MRFHVHRTQSLIISILLMMVCVQTFSMHFHFSGGEADQHTHAHAHAPGGIDVDHLNTGHDDEVSSELPGVIAKQTFSIDSFVFILLILVAVAQTKLRIQKWIRRKRPHYYLLFYRPPLRAPPL